MFSLVLALITALLPESQFSFGGVLGFFLFSLPAYLILGIPSSYLADWLEPFYIKKTNKFTIFISGFGIYLVLGGVSGFIFGYVLNGDHLFSQNAFLGYLYLGALASLGFYFAQLLLSKFNPVLKR